MIETIPVVKATNVTNLRKNLKSMLEMITREQQTLIITRGDSEDVVLMTESEYEEMVKTINSLNYELKLLRSIKQLEEGKTKEYTIKELEEMAR